jgi:chaperone modulatory protein CbpM
MQTEDLIPAETFCACHSVELSFIHNLHDSGLIEMTIREGTVFLPSSDLARLERLIRLHYEMDINIEGIEAVSHLLQRLDDMERQLVSLQNRIRFYQAAGTRLSSGSE